MRQLCCRACLLQVAAEPFLSRFCGKQRAELIGACHHVPLPRTCEEAFAALHQRFRSALPLLFAAAGVAPVQCTRAWRFCSHSSLSVTEKRFTCRRSVRLDKLHVHCCVYVRFNYATAVLLLETTTPFKIFICANNSTLV